jgi:DNA-binding transcriptional LysR family regulator
MDLRQIQYFVALVEEESITKAARRLHVVQPAVSMQIRRLEADFGLTLFERTPQGVLPNAIAQRVYPMCLDVLEKTEAIRAVLREASGRVAGRLAVGIPPSFAQGVMARALMSFRDQSPDVQIAIHEGYSANLVDWLVQGNLDFAVLSIIEGEKRLRYQPLATEELMLVTGAATELPEGDVRGVDLADLKLIVPSANNLIRMLLDAEFERAGVPLRPAMEVDSLVTVFGLLSNPGWATILPRSAAREDGSQGDLRWVRLVEPSVRRTLVIASLPQREPSPAAQLLIGHLENALHMASSAWPGHKAP